MSQENVEIVRGMYRPDPTRFFELLDDRVQVDTSKAELLPDHAGVFGGKDAAIDFYRRYWGTWDEYALDPTEIVDAGQDRILVVQDERGVGKGSGAPFERSWALLYTIREAKIVRIEHFSGRQEALEAVAASG